MRKNLRTAVATAAVGALTGGLLVAVAGPAAAVPGLEGDFNGDGHQDVAVSAPRASVGGHAAAGSVTVLYGSPAGAGAAKVQTLSQNSTGVPGGAEASDGFGSHTTAGDFNGDGYADLAVGVPGEDVGSDTNGGTAVILWGGSAGLSGGTTVSDPVGSSHDSFGAPLAAGDYDGDGGDDLAIGSDQNTIDIYRGGFTKSGSTGGHYTVTTPVLKVQGNDIFNLTPGDVNNDGRTDLLVDGYEGETSGDYYFNANYYLPGSTGGVTTSGARKLPAGLISDIGDVDNDGYGDIVIGNHWDASSDSPGTAKGGAIQLVWGTSTGPTGGTGTLEQNSDGVPGTGETGDAFGWELSLGDINGDGYDDLAIGSPGEDLNGIADAGMVSVLYGSTSGFQGAAAQSLAQDTPGVPGGNEKNDGFGGELLLTDATGDGRADLTVGLPGENNSDGYVVAFASDGSKINTSGRGIGLTAAKVPTSGTPRFGIQMAD
ncbi:FG-GAP-like repeat-containing protein [Streptomyces sp. NPDC056462]|uniref:FG-GAP-like repeat-containing protein n=1 Tax=Streptomyces sp. NPDC056462 TaxID=3345826 RepID=UPI003698DB19